MSHFKVVLVSIDGVGFPEGAVSDFAKEGIDLAVDFCDTPEEVVSAGRDADVVWQISGEKLLTAEILPRLERCRAILRTGTGTDNVAVEEATRSGIIVANTPEAVGHTVAEHSIGLLWAVMRQIAVHDRVIRQGTWDRFYAWPRWHVTGQTLGLMGFGRIAQLVVKKVNGLEMKKIAFDPVVDERTMEELGVEAVTFDELLERSDFLSIHCPLTEQTYHLIDESALRKMKAEAILINTARGQVVDEPALCRALSEGWIAAAGLDVLEKEPPESDNPLLRLDNVVITPHIAGDNNQCLENFWDHSMRTLIEMSKNRWPIWCVNPEVKPRWKLSNERA